MSYQVKILANSISPTGVRLTTMEIRYPRIILAEFNTHRQFSRNTASSRAIPIKKMIEAVDASICPIQVWGKNQPGMQAEEELKGYDILQAQAEWNVAKENALLSATKLAEIGAHKQIVNRLLEPFMWITTVVSATEWENFFKLRCHPAAQPEIRILAELMRDAYDTCAPVECEYHLPYLGAADFQDIDDDLLRMKVSAARCARVSYKSNTTGSPSTIDEDISLCERLLSSGHLSPFEHVAEWIPSHSHRATNFNPQWVQFRRLLEK